jgi:hypothetical protein
MSSATIATSFASKIVPCGLGHGKERKASATPVVGEACDFPRAHSEASRATGHCARRHGRAPDAAHGVADV